MCGKYIIINKTIRNKSAEYTAFVLSLKENKSLYYVREESFAGIVIDMAYLKHSLSRRMEFGRLVEIVPDSYFDELEARLPAWAPVAFDLTHNNRWAR